MTLRKKLPRVIVYAWAIIALLITLRGCPSYWKGELQKERDSRRRSDICHIAGYGGYWVEYNDEYYCKVWKPQEHYIPFSDIAIAWREGRLFFPFDTPELERIYPEGTQ